ncbi:hypothetical protein [Paenibacillus polymyxa]|uniref:hypothetical protein n=1 Tax=Paenibacillus polymyxa TaxID=1406 RepID=UPI002AB4D796|nr:hypothetical protein [Paenibacillus polymyxa]MDY8021112.1 hypothetical protein [Paenibacillus polymyxa]
MSSGLWDIDYEDYYIVSDQEYSEEEFEGFCKTIIKKHNELDSPEALSMLLAEEYGFIVPSKITEFHLKEYSTKAVAKDDEYKALRRMEYEYAKKPKEFILVSIKELSDKLKEAGMGEFQDFVFDLVDVADFYDYNEHQYLKTDFEIKTNKDIFESNILALGLFGGTKMYPVIDAYKNNEIYKVAIDSGFDHYQVEKKGVLVERLL